MKKSTRLITRMVVAMVISLAIVSCHAVSSVGKTGARTITRGSNISIK